MRYSEMSDFARRILPLFILGVLTSACSSGGRSTCDDDLESCAPPPVVPSAGTLEEEYLTGGTLDLEPCDVSGAPEVYLRGDLRLALFRSASVPEEDVKTVTRELYTIFAGVGITLHVDAEPTVIERATILTGDKVTVNQAMRSSLMQTGSFGPYHEVVIDTVFGDLAEFVTSHSAPTGTVNLVFLQHVAPASLGSGTGWGAEMGFGVSPAEPINTDSERLSPSRYARASLPGSFTPTGFLGMELLMAWHEHPGLRAATVMAQMLGVGGQKNGSISDPDGECLPGVTEEQLASMSDVTFGTTPAELPPAGTGKPEPVNEAGHTEWNQWREMTEAARCAAAEQCCQGTPICSQVLPSYGELLDYRPPVTFDAEAAAACAALLVPTCSDGALTVLPLDRTAHRACRKVLRGPVPVGGRCISDFECSGDALCYGLWGWDYGSRGNGGVCGLPVELAEPCVSSVQCPGDVACLAGHCGGLSSLHQPCMMNTDCASGLACGPDGPLCGEAQVSGGSCNERAKTAPCPVWERCVKSRCVGPSEGCAYFGVE